jgi:hypothetical protein
MAVGKPIGNGALEVAVLHKADAGEMKVGKSEYKKLKD